MEGRVDPVYGYLEFDDEYLDWCRDVPFLGKENNRLRKMPQLGLVSKINTLARHTRLEHHEGSYYLTRSAIEYLPGSMFKDVNKQTVRFASLIHGIGHLPMGYDAEDAVFLVLNRDAGFRSELEKEFLEVRERIKKVGMKGVRGPLNDFPWKFCRWLSAVKLLRNKEVIREHDNNVHIDKVMRLLVDDRWEIARLLRLLDRFDHVIRDSYYAGEMETRLILPAFLSRLPKGEFASRLPYQDMIHGMDKVLRRNVYESDKCVALRAAFQCSLISALRNGHVKISEMLQEDDMWLELKLENEMNWSVDEVARQIRDGRATEVYRGKMRNVTRRDAKRTAWQVHTAGYRKSPFQKQQEARVFSSFTVDRQTQDPQHANTQVSVWTFEEADLQVALKAVRKCEKLGFRCSKPEQVLYAFLGPVEVNYERHLPLFREALYKAQILQPGDFFKILDALVPSRHLSEDFDSFLRVITQWVPQTATTKLLENLEEIIISRTFQNFNFVKPDVRDKVLQELSDARGEKREKAKELSLYLSRQVEPVPRIKSKPTGRWVFPEVSVRTHGETPNTVDCISLYLFGPQRKPVLDLSECTVNTSRQKELEDTEKLERICHWLKNRRNMKHVRIRYFFNEELKGEQP